ncbi:MAG: autotransporter outer membrane beta-barrel domain-containing protein [Geminicoccaceae bacterium]
MAKTKNPLLLATLAAAIAAGSGYARAADGSFAGGGVLEDGFEALQQQLARQGGHPGQSGVQLVQGDQRAGGFTPRFAGVPIGLAEGISVDRGSVLKTRLSGAVVGRQVKSEAMQIARSHDLGLVKVDLSAIAGYADRGHQDLGQSSTFGFGGGLKFDGLEGLRFGASYDRSDEALGVARDRVTAGLGYDFGALNTQLSVSNVSQYDVNGVSTDEQQVWVVGGQMELSSRFVVGGDVAYSTSLDGTADTSGVVNFRFNF